MDDSSAGITAWDIVSDSSNCKAGNDSALAALLDDLGVKDTATMLLCDADDVAAIAGMLKKIPGKQLYAAMNTDDRDTSSQDVFSSFANLKVGGGDPAVKVDQYQPKPLLHRAPSEGTAILFECSICLSPMERPVTLICGHNNCMGCLDEAFKSDSKCPTCRTEISSDFRRNMHTNIVLQDLVAKNYPDLAAARELEAEEEAIRKLKLTANTKDSNGFIPLHHASKDGDTTGVAKQLRVGAEVNALEKDGDTPLIWASFKGHTESVKLLLAAQASVDIQSNNGNTALTLASYHDRPEVVKLLLEANADINIKNNAGKSALDLARDNNHVAIMELLRASGATEVSVEEDAKTKDSNGFTPLHHASKNGDTARVAEMLQVGAEVNALEKDGDTPLIWASFNGHTESVKLLLAAQASVDIQSNNGNTALTLASYRDRPEVVKLLLEANADINIKNNAGKSALDLARDKNHVAIMELLRASVSGKNKVSANDNTLASPICGSRGCAMEVSALRDGVGFSCDVCYKNVGAKRWRCHPCDHDICFKCFPAPSVKPSVVSTERGASAMTAAHAPVGIKCPRGHALEDRGNKENNGWACDGRSQPGGCVRGCTGFRQSAGWGRFRCNSCDFDLCDRCYARSAAASASVFTPPKCGGKGCTMVVSTYAGSKGGYTTGYICNGCRGRSATGHRGGSRERWFCQSCNYDLCFHCSPAPPK